MQKQLQARRRKMLTQDVRGLTPVSYTHLHAHTGEEIGDIKPAVFTDSIPGQACIKPKLHSRSPPVASMVSVSEIF